MSRKIKDCLVFLAGLAIGSGVTYYFTKKKCEKAAEKDISSVRETYNRLAEDLAKKNEEGKKTIWAHLNNDGYTTITSWTPNNSSQTLTGFLKEDDDISLNDEVVLEKVEPATTRETPYEIAAEEFGDIDGYEMISLTCYKDGVITDDVDDILDNPEDILGVFELENIKHYLKKPELFPFDAVYIRNDVRKCDYEILLDPDSYSETHPAS